MFAWLRNRNRPTEAQSTEVRTAQQEQRRLADVVDQLDARTARILSDVIATQELVQSLRADDPER